jgi:hypothetical protein
MSRRRSQSTPLARKRRPGDAQGDGIGGAEVAHALQAANPDGIAIEQILVLVDFFRHHLEQVLHPLIEVHRRLQREAAHAEIAEPIMRWPLTSSKILRISSRSRKV